MRKSTKVKQTLLKFAPLLGALVLFIAFGALLGNLFIQRSQSNDKIAKLETQLRDVTKKAAEKSDFKELSSSFLPPLRESDKVDGNRNAEIILIEYSDLECPFCKDLNRQIKLLKPIFGDKLAHVFRPLPLASIHPAAPMQAEAAECVAEQAGEAAFYTYIDAVFARSKSNGSSFSESDMQGLASTLGYDALKIKQCMDKPEAAAAVEESIKEARSLNISGTPTWFLVRKSDGKTIQVVGSKDYQSIKTAIEGLLKKS